MSGIASRSLRCRILAGPKRKGGLVATPLHELQAQVLSLGAADRGRLLQGQAVFGDAHHGLLPAAPRRTGKSTFLQADLKPALEAAGAVVAYVELWADPRRDPGSLSADAIARALAPRLGLVSCAAKAAGLESLTIAATLKIDVSKIGKIDGMTLPDALRALHEAAKAPVAGWPPGRWPPQDLQGELMLPDDESDPERDAGRTSASGDGLGT